MTLKERIEAAVAVVGEHYCPSNVLRDCAAEIERLTVQAENDADHARSLMAENERLMESMRKTRQHLWRIYSHYPEAEVAEAADSNSGSSLSEYGLALRILDAAIVAEVVP